MPRPKAAVVALGGNALLRPGQKGTLEEQTANVESAVSQIVRLVRAGYRVAVTHGNGPQVGNILLQNEMSRKAVPQMPLYVCVAESQALIGYVLQESLYSRLHRARLNIPVVTLVTQVLVDPKDRAFRKPSKPIGPYYSSEKGLPIDWHLIDTPKGWRRVVPSPEPKSIVEDDAIRNIFFSKKPIILIACGGGGIPVVKSKRPKGLRGVDAVIDKDLTAQKLAGVVEAELLVILTDVPEVRLNFGRLGEKKLRKMNIREAEEYLKKGQFPPGSMGPKVEAAVRFIRNGGKRVIITDFSSMGDALKGRKGTVIK